MICVICKGKGTYKHHRMILTEALVPSYTTIELKKCELCKGLGCYNFRDSIKESVLNVLYQFEDDVVESLSTTKPPKDNAGYRYQHNPTFNAKVNIMTNELMRIMPEKLFKE